MQSNKPMLLSYPTLLRVLLRAGVRWWLYSQPSRVEVNPNPDRGFRKFLWRAQSKFLGTSSNHELGCGHCYIQGNSKVHTSIIPSTNASTFFRLALNSPKHLNYHTSQLLVNVDRLLLHLSTWFKSTLLLHSESFLQLLPSHMFKLLLYPFHLICFQYLKKQAHQCLWSRRAALRLSEYILIPFSLYAAWLINLLSCFSLFQIKLFVNFILPAACCSTF